MKENSIYIIESKGEKREINYIELNQLKKDILWIYDQNISDMNNALAPSYSFNLKYWKYLSLDGDKWFYEDEKKFFKIGTLIILLSFCVEYNDVAGGDQGVFDVKYFSEIIKYVNSYVTENSSEQKLKDKIILGLEIANSMTEDELLNSDFEHKKRNQFLKNINQISDKFILEYYKGKINNSYKT